MPEPLQPYERANGKSIWHNLQRRRYGGDLQASLTGWTICRSWA